MKLFVIHSPPGPPAPTDTDGARAARTGFSFGALIFGPLWLLARGLWLALLGYAVFAGLAAALVAYAGLRPGGALALFALAELYLGIEGRALAVAARTRGGRALVDVICARNALEAEKVYLERALTAPPPPPARAPARRDDSVIGVFPEPGR